MTADAIEGHRPGWTAARISLAVAVVAFVIRAWDPAHLAIGHYDEGVYAVSADGVAALPNGHLFPGQIRFAPPLWFTLVGGVARLGHIPTATVATGLNVVLGAALAAFTCWLGFAWLGAVAGVTAGLVVATSPLAVMLSRSGLTDPLFSLLFVLGLWLTTMAIEKGGRSRLIPAGLLVGAAWNTKYHGWFVPVVAGGAVLLGAFRRPLRAALPTVLQRLRRLVLVAVIAFGCYLPWLLYMRRASGNRGLGGVAQYYLALIGEGWLSNAAQHVGMQLAIDTVLARGTVPLALGLVAVLTMRAPSLGRWLVALAAILVADHFAGSIGSLGVLALAGVVALRGRLGELPIAAIACWLGLWIVAAPLYHPYARLLLPALPAFALLAGAGAMRVVEWTTVPFRSSPRAAAPAAAIAAALLVPVVPARHPGVGDPWRDAGGSRRIAAAISERIGEATPVLVLGEPSIGYYLSHLGHPTAYPADDFSAVDTATGRLALVAGPYVSAAPGLQRELERVRPRLDSIWSTGLDPTDLRLLDDLDPAAFRASRAGRGAPHDVVLYVLRHPGPTAGAAATP